MKKTNLLISVLFCVFFAGMMFLFFIMPKQEFSQNEKRQGSCFSLGQLAVRGGDLTALGLRGPAVGETLRELLELVIEEALPNDREALMTYVRERRR